MTGEHSRSGPAWVEHVIWWQVYPLGFVGAYPADPAPGPGEHRLRRIADWLDYAIELGASGLALGPVFASRTHGYDTTDHYRIDPRPVRCGNVPRSSSKCLCVQRFHLFCELGCGSVDRDARGHRVDGQCRDGRRRGTPLHQPLGELS